MWFDYAINNVSIHVNDRLGNDSAYCVSLVLPINLYSVYFKIHDFWRQDHSLIRFVPSYAMKVDCLPLKTSQIAMSFNIVKTFIRIPDAILFFGLYLCHRKNYLWMVKTLRQYIYLTR